MTVTPVGGETRIRDLESAVARLSARVDALEQAQLAAAAPPHLAEPSAAQEWPGPSRSAGAAATARTESPGWLGLIGRTCIVLGGAFSLRAVTNSGQVPLDSGVWLGLAYAVLWLTLAGRSSGPSAFFHGVTALLIALPLVWEAVLTYKVMSGVVGALVLTSFTVAALGVSWYKRQHALAMCATLAAISAALGLAIGLSQLPGPSTVLAPTVALILIGTTTLWVSHSREWTWLPWPAAAGADAAALIIIMRASAIPPRDSPLATQLVLAMLVTCYLGSFVIRIVLHEREVRMFDLIQTALVLLLGLGGGVAIARANHISVIVMSLPALIAGTVLYVQTFTVIASKRGFGAEFYYAGMTALALTLTGVSLLFEYPTRPMVIGFGALAGSLAAWRLGHPLLALQGAIAAIVAAAQSGLIIFTTIVWLTHAQTWPSMSLPIAIVLAAVSAALLVPRAVHDDEPPALTWIARIALALALAAGLASLAVIGASAIAGTTDPGRIATLKTVILAGAAAALAWAGRSPRFVEFTWLAYGVLAVGGVKILIEDLSASRPSTLFLALAVYGAALIGVQRIASARSATH